MTPARDLTILIDGDNWSLGRYLEVKSLLADIGASVTRVYLSCLPTCTSWINYASKESYVVFKVPVLGGKKRNVTDFTLLDFGYRRLYKHGDKFFLLLSSDSDFSEFALSVQDEEGIVFTSRHENMSVKLAQVTEDIESLASFMGADAHKTAPTLSPITHDNQLRSLIESQLTQSDANLHIDVIYRDGLELFRVIKLSTEAASRLIAGKLRMHPRVFYSYPLVIRAIFHLTGLKRANINFKTWKLFFQASDKFRLGFDGEHVDRVMLLPQD